MLRYLLLGLFVAVAVSAVAAAQEKESGGFRKAKWGMSKAQVRATEGNATPTEAKGGGLELLTYHDTVVGLPCEVVYIFANDQLTRATYISTVEHSNRNEFVNDFAKLRDPLERKYGKPVEQGTIWSNDSFRNDPAEIGTAIGVGHASMFARWVNEATIILLHLDGDNFRLRLGIEYTSLAYQQIEEMWRQRAADDKL
jgi:hypothetical protein